MLNMQLKKELKNAKKEMKRCKKQYPDWENNEYNCGPLKFIWGIKSQDDLTSCNVNFYSMNDIDVVYNRDTHKYLLGIETIFEPKSIDAKIKYLNNLLEKFKFYLKENEKFDCNFNPHSLYLYNSGELFIADSLTALYYKFKLFVKGFENL